MILILLLPLSRMLLAWYKTEGESSLGSEGFLLAIQKGLCLLMLNDPYFSFDEPMASS